MSELRLGQDKAYLENKAKYEGLTVILPEPDEIFLDIDKPDGAPNFAILEYIERSLCTSLKRPFLETKSKSGNTHIYIKTEEPISDLARVIFQVCLGSDPTKELFSFIQLKHIPAPDFGTCECPVALFETPAMAEKVAQWRSGKFTVGSIFDAI